MKRDFKEDSKHHDLYIYIYIFYTYVYKNIINHKASHLILKKIPNITKRLEILCNCIPRPLDLLNPPPNALKSFLPGS